MKTHLIFFVAFLLPLLSIGQVNLVLNPSFEDTLGCSTDTSTRNTKIWFNPTDCGTPDFFHIDFQGTCNSTFPGIWGGGTYSNAWGGQMPRTGEAYAGMAVTQGTELIAGKLSDTLISGKKYAVSFYTSLGDLWASSSGKGLDLIGICFLSDSITDYSVNCWQYLGTLQPDVQNQSGNFLTDTASWMLVQDSFVALGGERFFVLGNIDTGNTQYFNSPTPTACYYYFDDFDVHCIDCTSDTSDPPSYPEISLTPTLSSGEIALSGNFPEGTKFEVCDMLGQLVYYNEIQSGNQTQQIVLYLAAGVYSYRVVSHNNVLKADRLVIYH